MTTPQRLAGRLALVTGANRGIGLEVVHQLGRLGFSALLGSRDLGKGEEATKRFVDEGLQIIPVQLDITDEKGIRAADETTTILGDEHQEPRPSWLSVDPVPDARLREEEGGLRLTQNVPHPRGIGRLVTPNHHRLSTNKKATPPKWPWRWAVGFIGCPCSPGP